MERQKMAVRMTAKRVGGRFSGRREVLVVLVVLVKKNNAGQAQILVEWSNLPEGRLRKHTYKKMSHGPRKQKQKPTLERIPFFLL